MESNATQRLIVQKAMRKTAIKKSIGESMKTSPEIGDPVNQSSITSKGKKSNEVDLHHMGGKY